MFDPGYFEPALFDTGGVAAAAGFGPTQYFDCAYFDDTYFDVAAGCAEPVAPGGGRGGRRIYPTPQPQDLDELLAII